MARSAVGSANLTATSRPLPPPSASAALGRTPKANPTRAVAARHRMLLREFALMWPSVNSDDPYDGRPDSLNGSFTNVVKWQRKRKALLNSIAPRQPPRNVRKGLILQVSGSVAKIG